MKTVLITGASKGIGRTTALYFARKGWNVVATMRSPEKETELTKGKNILVTSLDVESKASIDSAIEQGISTFGNIDVVINNAGYGAFGLFESATEEQIQRQFNVNVFGLMWVTKAILPHFRKNRQGLIINITSEGGRITYPLFSLYHATKFAVNGFTEALLYELAPLNIRVKIVEPGPTKTEFAGKSMDFLENENLLDYSEFESKVGSVYETLFDPNKISSPEFTADVIYEAATDPSNRLRYQSGSDLLKEREALTDDEFINKVAHQFGIHLSQ
ncbi:short-chain dehydrogenase/reductase [Pullulanibacillus camelliae]|uniref:Short-chain dehydrogenase/reductase n=1 Tax=Pullulanibacillus camelliae TaxID=1707096 RepID=A0A8J2VP43_9BACL|nr:SDR family oxidoreductase [Pullulanibacillus camelliae]GGE35584.1 short-chain dehydrogenase/reductase [Pullulanibacillus camelliae]